MNGGDDTTFTSILNCLQFTPQEGHLHHQRSSWGAGDRGLCVRVCVRECLLACMHEQSWVGGIAGDKAVSQRALGSPS